LPEPRILVDPDYRILSANSAYKHAFGNPSEIICRTCYEISHHYDKPCVPVDCSGMTESLFESELFGYEKGAFTAAAQRKGSLVEAAAGGNPPRPDGDGGRGLFSAQSLLPPRHFSNPLPARRDIRALRGHLGARRRCRCVFPSAWRGSGAREPAHPSPRVGRVLSR